MQRIPASTKKAQEAAALVSALQQHFVSILESVSEKQGSNRAFRPVEWGRDAGRHGGGVRYVAPGPKDPLFNRASVNMSQVHYEDLPDKPLASATALSTIIHPTNPFTPSIHVHISWTEMKSGKGYWRIMADLNPSIPDLTLKNRFRDCLQNAAKDLFSEAEKQGEKYFYIPSLHRHRGIAHFYLENYHTSDHEADYELASRIGYDTLTLYGKMLAAGQTKQDDVTEEELDLQRNYHTLYFYQVLTLDRGTTSGLMVHNQNDIGIMGSLPSHINKTLLLRWQKDSPPPQDKLVAALIEALPAGDICHIDENTKKTLAETVRNHYKNYPEALKLQASGFTVPKTITNHRDS